MNIRSLTLGAAMPAEDDARAALVAGLGDSARLGRTALEGAGFTMQTVRLSTQPAERWLPQSGDMAPAATELGEMCLAAGIDYCSLGTVQAAHPGDAAAERLMEAIPGILTAGPNLFASVQVGARDALGESINREAVSASARTIHSLAAGTEGGFGNLRFAAAANCPPHIPFFPASYYEENERNAGSPEFGLALEAADLAVRAFEEGRTPEEGTANLLALLADEGGRAAEVCSRVASDTGFTFVGLDISMAPYPDSDRSIARAIEMLSGVPFGAPGTLAAAAAFTATLREARKLLPTTGYSGLMLPALEDQTLADRASEGLVTLDTLLLLSAVCGLGLDTVPLPGDTTVDELERVILDMAALAVRLDKPLTARLMPVPGRGACEPAEWPDFPYFARGTVYALPGRATSPP